MLGDSCPHFPSGFILFNNTAVSLEALLLDGKLFKPLFLMEIKLKSAELIAFNQSC